MADECRTCRHFKLIDREHGECRRVPPKVIHVIPAKTLEWVTAFPMVKLKDWCGEYDVTREPIATYEVKQ